MRRSYRFWFGTACAAATAVVLVAEVAAPLALVPTTLVANGSWTRSADALSPDAEDARMWSVELQRDGSSITGQIVLPGIKELQTGNVHGQILGQWVWGTITDKEEYEVATFEGTLGMNGVEGTYEMINGEVGPWSWSPPKAQASEAIEEAS